MVGTGATAESNMNQSSDNRPATSRRWKFAIGATLLLVLALLITAGVRRTEVNHAVAKVEFTEVDGPVELERLKEATRELEGHRRSSFARTALDGTNAWRAEIEFRAESLTDATIRLLDWKKQFEPDIRVDLGRVEFHTLRFRRGGRGDLVMGTTVRAGSAGPRSAP